MQTKSFNIEFVRDSNFVLRKLSYKQLKKTHTNSQP